MPPALTGNAEFVVSNNFVIGSSIEHSQRCNFSLDCSDFLKIDRASRSAKLRFERTDNGLRQRDTELLADLFGKFMSGGILDVERAHKTSIHHWAIPWYIPRYKIFTARAASNATVASEIKA